MATLDGFDLGEVIHSRTRTQVMRARSVADGHPVVVKVLRDEYPSERSLAAFELAYKIGQRVACDAVVGHLALEKYGNGLALVTEDFGGTSLERLTGARQLAMVDCLRVGLRVCDALQLVHAKNVIHKDIKPHNVVMNPETGDVKLIDFGIASQLTREHPSLKTPGRMEGTLAYVSPEQTGRMNRSIDSRSDLYSLGVMLYELFTGQLPFQSDDPMELIHGHLARLPTPPTALNPALPPAVSDVIMKLLAKMPEDRYQTARGAGVDLARCLASVEAGTPLDRFELGCDDVSHRFDIPERLYGREAEGQALLDAFGRASAGAREFLLVAGYSGIGKSALIQEVYRPITEHRGWFCGGKFDQFRRDIPYQALVDALRDLMRQLLTEAEDRIAEMRTRLLAALGDNGQVIIDVVPELQAVIGAQDPVAEVGPTEAQNRFNGVFKNFIRVFARPEHPLTVFIDDLQWADTPSLKLIEVLVTDGASGHLFLVGAYRDNEVYDGHPLMDALRSIRAAGEEVHTITLAPLNRATVTALVADTLASGADDLAALGQLVHDKTGGNPFFVKELLRTLYRDRLVDFDAAARRWTWDLAAVQAVGMTDNVVELVASKLQTLAPETIAVLQHAACIGNRFDLRTLGRVWQRPMAETARAMDAALADGFVLPTDDAYKYMGALDAVEARGQADAEGVGTAWYRFLHDRVHQAAYSLLSEDERRTMHRRTGRILWDLADADERESILMDVASHFDMSVALLTDPAERREVAKILLEAGKRAKASMAFGPAAHYLSTGLSLLPQDAWTADYDLALAMHTQAAESQFLNARYDEMEALVETVLAHAKTWLHEATVEAIRVKAKIAQQQHMEALQCAFRVLDRFGIELPREPTMDDIMAGLVATKTAIGERSPKDLVDLPLATDPEQIAAMELLMSTAPSAYFVMPNNFLVINFHLVRLSVEHGFCVPSIYGYVVYGMLNAGIFGDPAGGYGFGRLGWTLLDKYDVQEQIGRMSMIWGSFVGHWQDHCMDGARVMFDKYRAAEAVGDLEHAAYDVLQALLIEVLAGRPLDGIATRYADAVEWVHQAKQQQSIGLTDCYYQAVINLSDGDQIEPRLIGEHYDYDTMTPRAFASGDAILVAYASIAQAHIALVFRDWRRCAAALDNADKVAEQLMCTYQLVCGNFYRSLSLIQLLPDDAQGRAAALERVAANQAQLDVWATASPINHRHKHALVEAELAREAGDGMAALVRYQHAIEGARAGGFINEEAIACELVADHYQTAGIAELADQYRRRAHGLYRRWGARAKTTAMEQVFDTLRTDPAGASHGMLSASATQAGLSVSETTETLGDSLDLSSFMKAGRTISGEIDLGRLLGRVMDLVIENAGADRGTMLLVDDTGTLQLEVVGSTQGEAEVLDGRALDGQSELPQSLIQYCQRTLENIVIVDVSKDELFGRDPHFLHSKPQSVLAAPISNHGKLVGIVYLENHLSTGVFTQQRVGVVEMLCAQAAVSIENARLFDEQKRQADSFARFVPQQFLRHLGRRRIVDVELGDSMMREITVLFSDLRGFTSISEKMTAKENFDFLNRYLAAMQPCIDDNEGFIDKFIGDAVMALFPGGAADALRAGIAMHQALDRLNADRSEGSPQLIMGIGVHTGPLMLGTIGSPSRMETTVIGDSVNLASRIEDATKAFSARLLTTGQTLEALDGGSGVSWRAIGRVKVKGKAQPVEVFEVLEADPDTLRAAKSETKDAWEQAIQAYFEADFYTARETFADIARRVPTDATARFYRNRCGAYLAAGGAPSDWDAVERLD